MRIILICWNRLRRPNAHDNRPDGADSPDDIFIGVINKLRGVLC